MSRQPARGSVTSCVGEGSRDGGWTRRGAETGLAWLQRSGGGVNCMCGELGRRKKKGEQECGEGKGGVETGCWHLGGRQLLVRNVPPARASRVRVP